MTGSLPYTVANSVATKGRKNGNTAEALSIVPPAEDALVNAVQTPKPRLRRKGTSTTTKPQRLERGDQPLDKERGRKNREEESATNFFLSAEACAICRRDHQVDLEEQPRPVGQECPQRHDEAVVWPQEAAEDATLRFAPQLMGPGLIAWYAVINISLADGFDRNNGAALQGSCGRSRDVNFTNRLCQHHATVPLHCWKPNRTQGPNVQYGRLGQALELHDHLSRSTASTVTVRMAFLQVRRSLIARMAGGFVSKLCRAASYSSGGVISVPLL